MFSATSVWLDDCMTGDRELLHSLMFDAEATRGAMSGWRKENFEDTPRLVEHHALVLFFARVLMI